MILAEHNTASHSVTAAVRWAAPELIACPADIQDFLSLKSDMYSFGSIMFHVSSVLGLYGCNQHSSRSCQALYLIMDCLTIK